MEEIFKDIPGFEYYQVSNLGRIRLIRIKNVFKILEPGTWNGYRTVNLYRCIRKIAYFVLLTFIGPRPKNKEISHLDGNRLNDKLENLRWETHSENMLRRYRI